MDRIEFYKMSIEEYPNHKDKSSLNNSVNFLKNDYDKLNEQYNHIQANTEGLRDLEIESELDEMQKIIIVGEKYLNNESTFSFQNRTRTIRSFKERS